MSKTFRDEIDCAYCANLTKKVFRKVACAVMHNNANTGDFVFTYFISNFVV